MNILWCGGEDLDFTNGATPAVSISGGYYRSTFARCAVSAPVAGTPIKSVTFSPVTSVWLSAQVYCYANTASQLIGLGKSGVNSALFLGTDAANNHKFALIRVSAGVVTQLAAEAGASLVNSACHRVDIQVVNYGVSATFNIWVAGVLIISYSGDITLSGAANLNQVWCAQSATFCAISEVVVADSDTRGLPGVMTGALTGAGATDQWTGVYSTINQTTISDLNPNYSNTTGQDQQFVITAPPGGVFLVAAVKIAARAAMSASTPTHLALGYRSGGTVAFSNPTGVALGVGYATCESLDQVNPVTGVAFTLAEIGSLQLDLRTAA
jgi:hypothetical protein